ncbi:TonB-dependent receptor [Chitinophaga arvensicola]|uniref:TonB-dependent Receptor Plug Domain n=1 Tax=Chitinophaga arvensicola TaxID=29529 RepID=A0A1I0QGD8_9BACT|nr:TonB-dependent receptor [Chitinophaga arvensicola]SEW26168.1 TonB-dependent Receptor Plug Domain [Chitinophaga arvensicola]
MSLALKLLTGIFILCFPLQAFGWDWQTKVTVVVKDQPLEVVCGILEKEYGIHFSYSRELVNLSRKVTLTAHQQRLKKLLDELFSPDDIRFTRVGEQIVLLPAERSTRTISGYIKDASSGENLIGATVYAPALKQGTTTNQYGFFSLTTVKDTNSLVVSYVGYQPHLQRVPDKGDHLLNVTLQPLGSLKEVVISAKENSKLQEQTQMSKVKLNASEVQSMPRLLGEVDVMRTLQSLPGVSGGSDGAGGLYVRGGGPDQNLVLIDGTPVFNFSHFFGVYSLLNANVVKTTDLYKGAFPARFGGRISSVVDIAMKEGDMKEYHGDASIGLIAAKFNIEGPIVKDKTSFMLSARRSYPDLLLNAALQSDNSLGVGGDFQAYFYDVNAKVNHIFSPKDRVFLSFYRGEDNLSIKQTVDDSTYVHNPGQYLGESSKFQLGWGNTIAAIRWNHIYGPRLFSNISLNFSQYEFFTEYEHKYVLPTSGEKSDMYGTYNSVMTNSGGRIDFDFRPNPRHSVRFGAITTMHNFKPGNASFEDKDSPVTPLDTLDASLRVRGLELSLYAEDDWQIKPDLFASIGVHASGFLVEGRFYYSLQPRLGLRYVLPRNWAVKAAYTHMNQYIHLLSSNGNTLPTDIWVPSTQRVAPLFSKQIALGVGKTSSNLKYEFTLEGYYKSMSNMIENKETNGIISPLGSRWDENVTVGKGWSYGAEVMLQKKKGSTTGWIGYTLSWSERRFPGINNGEIYPYKYDHRHDIEFVLVQQLGRHWEFSASWHFNSGTPITLPVASYAGGGNASPWDPSPGTPGVDRFDNWNNYRGQAVHRMDVGITWNKQKKRWSRSWNLSVFNVYNRKNPFLYLISEDAEAQKRYLSKLTILPILPSITYSIKF